MKSNYKRLGDYIRQVDIRNKGLQVKKLVGLSISKQFIASVANIIGTDMENYKIIKRNQFACSTMQVRRDKKMPVALFQEDEAIISQAYPVFEVIDESKLLPEYLMMWFAREEFDREACFHAVGGVRGSLEWEDFETMKLPVPSLDVQKSLVAEYKVIQDRINLNQQLIQKLEETVQSIFKDWFVDFQFSSNENGRYKSSGGELVYSEQAEREIPKGWRVKLLDEYTNLSQGIQVDIEDQSLDCIEGMNRFLRIIDYTVNKEEPPRYVKINDKRYFCRKNEIVMIRYGDAGTVCRRIEGIIANNLFKISPINGLTDNYLYYYLKDPEIQKKIRTADLAVAMPAITHKTIKELPIVFPENNPNLILEFDEIAQKVERNIILKMEEIEKLKNFKKVLLSRLATIGGN